MNVLSKILIILVVAAIIIGAVWFFTQQGPAESQPSGSGGNQQPSGSASGLVISEVMAANQGIFPDNAGNYSDWVELYNGTPNDISLMNLSLTNDNKDPMKYPLPNITLKRGGYLIVFMSGKSTSDFDNNVYHAPFKISGSKGDKVYLYNGSGDLIDSMEFEYMDDNVSYARLNGEWQITYRPTPGFPNTEEGYDAFVKSRIIKNSPVIISEVMTSNKVTLPDSKGQYHDYIELTNRGDQPLNLEGFGLTDNLTDPMKYRLPNIELAPGEFVVIYCSGERSGSTDQEFYAPFRLSSYKESVGLFDAVGMQLDAVTVEEIASDTVYSRNYENGKPTDNWVNSKKPSPGYPNSEEGYNAFLKKNELALGDIIISEVLASNTSFDLEGNGYTYDYVELYNRGSQTVDLTNYCLSTNTKNPAKYRFPEMSIAPGEYKLILSNDPENKLTNPKYPHFNFGLSKEGEMLVLYDDQDKPIDKLYVEKTPKDVSYGREANKDGFYFFTRPAPGQQNTDGCPGFTQPPTFSQVPGKYDKSISVAITAGENETIYYTTDATAPTTNSNRYTSPIPVDQTTVIRAISKRDGYMDGSSVTATYFINANHQLPLISLVTDPKNLWDPKIGIYVLGENVNHAESLLRTDPDPKANYMQRGSNWERPGSIEFYNDAGKEVFSQNISMRIAGGNGRWREQKSFAIIARNEYGESKLNYPFFSELPFNSYKALVLRQGAQDQTMSKIRDVLQARILRGYDIHFIYQEYQPSVLYLNGEYWGVYFNRPKRNRFLVAQYENADPDTVTLLKSATRASSGTTTEWKKFMEYVRANDASSDAVYKKICEEIDIDSFTDYMAFEIYTANSDYANIQFYKVPGGKWKWILYDFCWSFGSSQNGAEHQTLSLRQTQKRELEARDLFLNLLKNSKWKDKFCRRMAELMNTVFEPTHVNKCIDELYALVEPEMEAERAKFNAATFRGLETPETSRAKYSSYENQVQKVRDFANKRPASMKTQFKSVLGLSDSYMKEVFG